MAVYAVDIDDKKKMIGFLSDNLAQEVYEEYWYDGADFTGKILDITGGTNDKPTLGCNIEFNII